MVGARCPGARLGCGLAEPDVALDESLDAHGVLRCGEPHVPGPVDFASATVVSPPIMTGWDAYPIRAWFDTRFDCPVIVDNDVNAIALGEHDPPICRCGNAGCVEAHPGGWALLRDRRNAGRDRVDAAFA